MFFFSEWVGFRLGTFCCRMNRNGYGFVALSLFNVLKRPSEIGFQTAFILYQLISNKNI